MPRKSNTTRDRKYDAVIAGYLGADLAPGFLRSRAIRPLSELLRPGKLLQVKGLSISLGGVVPNTGLAMKKFGQRVRLMGLVGKDEIGDIVLRRLSEKNAASGIRRTALAGTAYGIVLAPPGFDRMFLEDPGCNAIFSCRDIDFKAVSRSRLFHFGYPTLMAGFLARNGAALVELMRRVRNLGVATSLDMTLPDPDSPAGKADWQTILSHALPFVDIFVPSIEEILFMLDPAQYARIAAKAGNRDIIDMIPPETYRTLGDRILALGTKILIIKAGHRGAYMRTGHVDIPSLALPVANWSNCEIWIPPCPVDTKRMQNACGAGDAAVAGFLSALLNGETLERAGRFAMLAGRDNLYGIDALQGLRSWKAMKR